MLVEIVEHIAEIQIYGIAVFVFQVLALFILPEHVDGSRLAVYHHEPALVAMV